MSVFNFYKPKSALQWIIFLAAMGIALSSPMGIKGLHNAIYREIEKRRRLKEWKKLKELRKIFSAKNIADALYHAKKQKIVSFIENTDGTVTLILTSKGRIKKLRYDLDELDVIAPEKWDGQWRLLMYDIPKKKAREAFREKLKQLGFVRFQKSVWVHPYPCENEIDFVVAVFEIQKYVTLLTVRINNDLPLRKRFRLA